MRNNPTETKTANEEIQNKITAMDTLGNILYDFNSCAAEHSNTTSKGEQRAILTAEQRIILESLGITAEMIAQDGQIETAKALIQTTLQPALNMVANGELFDEENKELYGRTLKILTAHLDVTKQETEGDKLYLEKIDTPENNATLLNLHIDLAKAQIEYVTLSSDVDHLTNRDYLIQTLSSSINNLKQRIASNNLSVARNLYDLTKNKSDSALTSLLYMVSKGVDANYESPSVQELAKFEVFDTLGDYQKELTLRISRATDTSNDYVREFLPLEPKHQQIAEALGIQSIKRPLPGVPSDLEYVSNHSIEEQLIRVVDGIRARILEGTATKEDIENTRTIATINIQDEQPNNRRLVSEFASTGQQEEYRSSLEENRSELETVTNALVSVENTKNKTSYNSVAEVLQIRKLELESSIRSNPITIADANLTRSQNYLSKWTGVLEFAATLEQQ